MNRYRRIEALVFDMDDTLYPERDYVLSGFKQVAPLIENMFGIPAEDAFLELKEGFDSGTRGMNFNKLLDERKVLYERKDIEELVEAYRSHDPDIELPKEVSETLDLLAREYKLGMLTDGYLAAQRKKAERLGITRLMLAIVYTDELGREYWKPSPEPFLKISSELSTPPESCIYFGDNPVKDFKGAKDVGMLAAQVLQWNKIRLNKLDDSYQPHYLAEEFIDIPELVYSIIHRSEQ